MAKKKEVEIFKEQESTEGVEAQKSKPKIKTTAYPLKVRQKVGGVWREKGETISLTNEGFRFYRSKKII